MDGSFALAMADLVDILKRRQIKRIQYFHADHFEPWSRGLNEKYARGVERMGAMSRASAFGRKLSLFYCAYVPYDLRLVPTEGMLPGDAVFFGPRSADQDRIATSVIRPLVTSDQHEMHLHVHHEWWTRNDSNLDSPVSRWVNANSTADMDCRRLDHFFDRCKQVIAGEIGRSFDRWGFVHGNWALAASDPLICTVENELSMIMRHGGWGDFSFPAGRGYCDPKLETPFTCLPLDCKRAYDDPDADPRVLEAGAGVLRPDRFFIWNSPIKARYSSIDYYSESNRKEFNEPEHLVGQWLNGSVTFGSDLFLKTHAHSMKWEYEIADEGSLIPHVYPPVIKVFEQLLRACDGAGVEFVPVTVNEAMTWLHAYDSGQPATEMERVADVVATQSGQAGSATKKTVIADAAAAPSKKQPIGMLASIESRIAPILRGWVQSDPKHMAGAGEFYSNLLSGERILQDYERAVLEYVVERFPADRTKIVEVGVGYGILSVLLAAAGYEVTAFEGDPLRLAGFQFLADSIGRDLPDTRSRLQPAFGWFPDAFEPSMLNSGRRNVLLMTNVVATATAQRENTILETARRFDDLIIDTTRFGVTRYEAEAAGRLHERVAATYGSQSSCIWSNKPNEIWHFEADEEGVQPPTASPEAPAVQQPSPPGMPTPERPPGPLDPASFNAQLLDLQRSWMAGDGAVHQPDDLYAAKIARGTTLEAYELAIADVIGERFDRDTAIMEIGSGYGALALRLAQDGYVVQGCEGDRRRSAAFAWHLKQYATRHPEVSGRLECVPGFFPDVVAPVSAKASKRLCLATNVTCTYTATHQDAIFDAMRDFDEVIIDLSRFGKPRDKQEDRDALRAAMEARHFEPVEQVHFAPPYEYWRFRVRPARTAGTDPAAADAVFPLKGQSGELYSIHGRRRLDACPVCTGRNTVNLWRMPMTLQVPASLYCFDFCRSCESVFLNPASETHKDECRKSDHHLRLMQDEAQWKAYEEAYDRFAKWIPDRATTLMDAACGVGQYLVVARKRAPDRWSRLIGLELSEKYVAHMRAQNIEAHLVDIDNDELGQAVKPETVDFVTFCDAFEHVERPLDALRKLLVTLRPGGRLVFTAQRYGTDVQAAVRPEPIYIGERVLKELPQRLGCRVVDVTTSGARYHVILEK